MNTGDTLRYRLVEIEHLVERLMNIWDMRKTLPYLELEDKPFGRYIEKQPDMY